MKQQIIDTAKTAAPSVTGYYALDGVPDMGNTVLDVILKTIVILPAILGPLKQAVNGIRAIFRKKKQ